jgi:hypothetical protein
VLGGLAQTPENSPQAGPGLSARDALAQALEGIQRWDAAFVAAPRWHNRSNSGEKQGCVTEELREAARRLANRIAFELEVIGRDRRVKHPHTARRLTAGMRRRNGPQCLGFLHDKALDRRTPCARKVPTRIDSPS